MDGAVWDACLLQHPNGEVHLICSHHLGRPGDLPAAVCWVTLRSYFSLSQF